MEKFLKIFFLVVFFSMPLLAQVQPVDNKKQELKEIQTKLEKRKKELEKWEKQQIDISRHISFLEKRKNEAKKTEKKLEYHISKAEKNINYIQYRRETVQSIFEQWPSALGADIRSYIISQNMSFPFYGKKELISQIFIEAAIYNRLALIEKIKGWEGRIEKSASYWNKRSGSLINQSKELKQQNKIRQRRYEQKLVSLSKTRKKYEQTLSELEELKNSAKSLVRFLGKFEEKSEETDVTLAKRDISSLKNLFLWPVDGKVISRFGKENIPSLGTWIFREGIKISAEKGQPVFSSLDGKVIYAGRFRSYGNVVVIDHGGFFTIYGFLLDDILVKKDDVVQKKAKIGLAGFDTERKNKNISAVYFEIRSGTKALNPLHWLVQRK